MRKIAPLKDWTTICTAAPSELLATIAVRNTERLTARCTAIVAKNLKLLRPVLEKHSAVLRCALPRAGSVCIVELLGENAAEFSAQCLRDAGVLLLPATQYSSDGQWFRLGLGRHSFPAALQAFDAWLTERS